MSRLITCLHNWLKRRCILSLSVVVEVKNVVERKYISDAALYFQYVFLLVIYSVSYSKGIFTLLLKNTWYSEKVNKKPFSGVKIPETSYKRLHRFKILYSLSSLVVVLKLHETWNKKRQGFYTRFQSSWIGSKPTELQETEKLKSISKNVEFKSVGQKNNWWKRSLTWKSKRNWHKHLALTLYSWLAHPSMWLILSVNHFILPYSFPSISCPRHEWQIQK